MDRPVPNSSNLQTPWPASANLHAGRQQTFGDTMVAQRALLRGVGSRAQKAAAVWTGLDAESAADAIFWVDQHRPVGASKVAPTGQTWTQGECWQRLQSFGTKNECRISSFGRSGSLYPFMPPIGHSTVVCLWTRPNRLGFGDRVSLNPGPVIRPFRNMVLPLAGFGAQTAANAIIDINPHYPFVFGGIVAFGRSRRGQHLLNRGLRRSAAARRGGRYGGPQDTQHAFVWSRSFSWDLVGAVGTWHSVHFEPG